jgi:hypothetical protein
MSTVSQSNTNSHYNPDEPRDERGRWTTGGSSWRANPVRRPSPAGRAHLLLGHALASAWHQGLIRQFKLPTPGAWVRGGCHGVHPTLRALPS